MGKIGPSYLLSENVDLSFLLFFSKQYLVENFKDVTKTGNGEWGTGVRERVYSGNPPENSKWRRKRSLIYKP